MNTCSYEYNSDVIAFPKAGPLFQNGDGIVGFWNPLDINCGKGLGVQKTIRVRIINSRN